MNICLYMWCIKKSTPNKCVFHCHVHTVILFKKKLKYNTHAQICAAIQPTKWHVLDKYCTGVLWYSGSTWSNHSSAGHSQMCNMTLVASQWGKTMVKAVATQGSTTKKTLLAIQGGVTMMMLCLWANHWGTSKNCFRSGTVSYTHLTLPTRSTV